MEFRTYFERPESPGLSCEGDEGETRQEFLEECDLNRMMAQYLRTGVFPVKDRPELYGDFSDPLDFQAAQELLARAREQFDGLPSGLRDRFHNEPRELLEFLQEEGNREEAVKLGLVNAPAPPPEPVKPMEVVLVAGPDGKLPQLVEKP